jgi:phage tail sheath protein FI
MKFVRAQEQLAKISLATNFLALDHLHIELPREAVRPAWHVALAPAAAWGARKFAGVASSASALLGWFEQRRDYFTGLLAGLFLVFVAQVLWSMQFGLAPASLPPRQDGAGAAVPAQAAPAGAVVAPAALVQVEQIYMGRSDGAAVTAFNAEPAAAPPAPQPLAKRAVAAKVAVQKPMLRKSTAQKFVAQTLSANHWRRNVRRDGLLAGR